MNNRESYFKNLTCTYNYKWGSYSKLLHTLLDFAQKLNELLFNNGKKKCTQKSYGLRKMDKRPVHLKGVKIKLFIVQILFIY